MKPLIYAVFAALFVCSLTSCQKNSDTSPQLNGDTVLTKYFMNYKSNINNLQNPVRYNFWTTGKNLSKLSIEPGDTLYNFVRNDKGDLISFKGLNATIWGVTTYLSTFELSYAENKITIVENWQSLANGYSGVTTKVVTLKDSLIINIEETQDGKLWEKTDFFYDEVGNVVKQVEAVIGVTHTYTYYGQYKNPFITNGERLLAAMLFGGAYMGPNYIATETYYNSFDTATRKYVVGAHWGSFPTKVHVGNSDETIDFSYDYSIK